MMPSPLAAHHHDACLNASPSPINPTGTEGNVIGGRKDVRAARHLLRGMAPAISGKKRLRGGESNNSNAAALAALRNRHRVADSMTFVNGNGIFRNGVASHAVRRAQPNVAKIFSEIVECCQEINAVLACSSSTVVADGCDGEKQRSVVYTTASLRRESAGYPTTKRGHWDRCDVAEKSDCTVGGAGDRPDRITATVLDTRRCDELLKVATALLPWARGGGRA